MDAQKEIEDHLVLQGATLCRCELVHSFFWAEPSLNLTRKEIALQVANFFNHTAPKILVWEKQWVMNR